MSAPPSGYLPSKKLQLTSQSRIAKINQLYEQQQRKHRDSVVSNNSTTQLFSYNDGKGINEDDNCIPISRFQEDIPREIKRERVSKPFSLPLISSTPPQRNKKKTFMTDKETVTALVDDYEEDYEEELGFTPKLKSRRSIESMRNMKHIDDPVRRVISGTGNGIQHRISRVQSLRAILGNPLPLPYIKNSNRTISHQRTISGNIMTLDTIERKRKVMESKWNKLIANDIQEVEEKLNSRKSSYMHQERQPSSVFHSFNLSEESGSKESSILPQEYVELSQLHEDIISNSDKLDHIITILKPNPSESSKTAHIQNKDSRHIIDYILWTICIIILIICNIYVFKYL